MKFLYPEILYALAAVAVPIIVHLFNFRKFKKVGFSNVSFLKEVKQETQSKSRLKHILILISRMLAITFIVLAFAQPFIPIDEDQKLASERTVSIFLDNSFSMQGNSAEGPMLEVVRNKALEIIDQYSSTDKFQLLTQDFEGRHQRLYSRDEMMELISEVSISPNSKDISEIISRQKDVLSQNEGERIAYILSDFQKSTTDLNECSSDTTLRVVLVPTQREEEQNIYIDSLWFATPVRQINEAERLFFRVKNSGDESSENIPAELKINGIQKAISTVNVDDLPADSVLTYTNINAGWKSGTVAISDYPITYDDQFYFSYKVNDQINVQEIKGKNVVRDHVQNIFNDDPFYSFNSSLPGEFTFETLNNTDLVILNQLNSISSGLAAELQKFVDAGGSLVIIPSGESSIQEYNGLLARLGEERISNVVRSNNRVNDINLDHFLFSSVFERVPDNIDLPQLNKWYKVAGTSSSLSTTLLSLNSGDPFLTEIETGNGRSYFFGSSLQTEDGNLAQHAIFVTALLRIAESAQPKTSYYYLIGEDNQVRLRNVTVKSDEVFRLKKERGNEEFIPEHRQVGGGIQVFLDNAIKEAGHYYLTLGSDTISLLSFNYPRVESELSGYNAGDLRSSVDGLGLGYSILNARLDNIGNAVGELSEGRKLWRSMIILALIFLAIEILLIKFWKRS